MPDVVGRSAPSEGEQLTFNFSPGRCDKNADEPPPSQFTAHVHPKSK